MPQTKTHDDPVLSGLRAQWTAKNHECESIIYDPKSTGPKLIEAEKAMQERDAISEQIDDRIATLERMGELKDRYSAGRDRMSEPYRGMPFSTSGVIPPGHAAKGQANADGVNQFSVSGWQPGGSATFEYDEQKNKLNLIAEAGPGTFGERQWATMRSFEYAKDWALYLRKGQRVIDLCHKTLQEGLDDQGGVFAPAELVARIIGRLPAPTMLRGQVTTLTTGRDTLILPRKQYSADDIYTTAFRPTWTGEIPYDGTGNYTAVNDANLLGNLDIQVHTAMLSAPVTRNLIEDSAFPIQAWLEAELAQVNDILYEDMIVNGSTAAGTALGGQYIQPIGILYGALPTNTEGNIYPEVILSSTAGGIDYGMITDLQTALAPQYETDSTRWVMAKKSTYRALCKLVDSQNRPLFTMGYEDSGMVKTKGRVLLGDQLILSQLMPAMSSTSYPIIYGDLKGYCLAQRIGFSIQILDQTKAKANQIELVGRVRFGGRPHEPWRLKIGKSNPS